VLLTGFPLLLPVTMGRQKITSRAELEKRNAAAAAKQSLKGSAKKTSTVASAAKRRGEDLVYSKKVLPLQKRLRIDKSVQEKKASGIQLLGCHLQESVDDDMKETNLLEVSGEGKKLAVEGAETLIPVEDKRQLHSREPLVRSKKSSGTKVDVKQSSEAWWELKDSPAYNMKPFCNALREKLSGKSESQGEYFLWNVLGREIGICFNALPSHCTFASGRWDSHVTESQLQQVDVNSSSDQQCGSSDCIVELDGQSVEDHPSSTSPHEDQQVAVQAPALEQASVTVAVSPKIKLKKVYVDEKLLADLEKLHKYYLDWRMVNPCFPGCDVEDGSLECINNSASMFPEIFEKHLEHCIKFHGYNFTTSDILTKDYGQIYKEMKLDPNVPPIDHRLWTYREVVSHILERALNPAKFHYQFYRPLEGKLCWQVFEITSWLKKNRSKYPCLEGNNDGKTFNPSNESSERHSVSLRGCTQWCE